MKRSFNNYKRIYFCLFLISFTYAQDNWYWQNPKPTGFNLDAIEVVSSSIIFTGGEAGILYKFSDIDQTWSQIGVPIPLNIKNISFLNEKEGFISGYFGSNMLLFSTDNGGESWNDITPSENNHLAFYFQDKDIGWAVIDSVLLRTNDGGTNWSFISKAAPFSQIFFFNNGHGLAIHKDKFYYSYDIGKSWEWISLDSFVNFWIDLQKFTFINDSLGYLVGYQDGLNEYTNHIFKTTDGGKTWEQQFKTWYSNYRVDIAFSNEMLGYALLDNFLYGTKNGGKDWDYISSKLYLKKLGLLDSVTIFSSGAYGALAASYDAGYTWDHKYSGKMAALEDFFMLDDKIGFAAGKNTLLKTTNSGFDWTNVDINIIKEKTDYISDVYFIDEQNGWLSCYYGNYGTLCRTKDGGLTWQIQLDSIVQVSDIFFLKDHSNGWFTSGDVIYNSSNRGQTWHIGGGHDDWWGFTKIFFTTSDTGWVGGPAGLYFTQNGGNSWVRLDLSLTVYDIFFIDKKNGWICGNSKGYGVIFKTINSGKNWELQHSIDPNYSHLEDIHFYDQNNGWAAGYTSDGYILLKTHNSGSSWEPVSIPVNRRLYKVQAVDSTHVWVLGNGGAILSSFNAVTGIHSRIKNFIHPETIALFQNFPNPFNSSTTIEYFLSERSEISLKLYDILGKLISILDNGYKNPGLHRVKKDFKTLSSGTYYYVLEANNKTEVKKLVLIK
ncbi:MAG: T9SS type A sorting domain-containing protein [Caldithrix sp.]|nr:T9SS type A sorting domain-containing protein [Caldithrix sp.]